MRPPVTIFTVCCMALVLSWAPVKGAVYFADPTLKAAVEARLGISDPTETQMLQLTSLTATGLGISDLTGLDYAVNLQELVLTYNQISDLSALDRLTALRVLDLSRNQISDLSDLSGLTCLEKLDLDYNRISSVWPLSGLTTLVYLDLTSNRISDLSPLSGLTGLQQLELCSNRISDLAPLSGLTGLRRLDLDSNRISDFSPLSGLSGLEELWLGSNQIWDLSSVSALSGLHRLSIDDNRISDLSPLCSLLHLSFLHLTGNPLNQDACTIHIPQISNNNPGIMILDNTCTNTPKVTLQASSTPGGSITLPGEGQFQYDQGQIILVEAKADPGFAFTHWSGSLYSTQNYLSLPVDQDYEIRAHFISLLSTLYVDDNAPGEPLENGSPEYPFNSIQEAIEVAALGTTVLVRPGTYPEDIDLVGKSIHLTGLDPNRPSAITDYPVISGTGSGPILRFASGEDPNCRVSGFVMTCPRALTAYALVCSKASPSIDHCLIVGNRTSASNGAIVYCQNSRAMFDHCAIADNQTGSQGAAMVFVDSNVVITHSILWGNAPKDVLLNGTGLATITYTDLADHWPASTNIHDDPHFADSGHWANGAWMPGDYHLRSQAGRWDVKTGTWVLDEVTSGCIDAGDPDRPVGNESLPHGGIVNLGAYGGTAQASRSYVAEVPVSFADTRLKAAVEDTLTISEPKPSDMLGLTSLTAEKQGIADLTGLEYAKNLTSLDLRYNRITDLSPLAGLSQLQYLTLRENRLIDISPLAGMSNLLDLKLTDNRICDLAPLANLHHIRTLELFGNYFNNLSSLLGLTNLSVLLVDEIHLDNMAYCSDLQTLLSNNPGLFSLEYDPNPRPPANVTASDGAYPDKVRVSWDPVCNGPAYTSYYKVSRASSQESRMAISPWQTASTFDDTTALLGTTYTYWVQTATSHQGLDAGDFSTSDTGRR